MILVEQDLFKETYEVVTSTSCVFFWPIRKLTFVFIAHVGRLWVLPSLLLVMNMLHHQIGSQFCYKKADHDVYS